MDFMAPAFSALESFGDVENDKVQEQSAEQNIQDFTGLVEFNLAVGGKRPDPRPESPDDFHKHQLEQALKAWHNTFCQEKGEDIAAYMARQARLMELVVHEYPQAIRDIEPEYGFHFEDGNYLKIAETDRFILYQVLPWNKSVKVRKRANP